MASRLNRSGALLVAAFLLAGCGPAPRDPEPSTRPNTHSTPPTASGSVPSWFEDVTTAAGLDFVHQVSTSRRYLFSEIMGSGAAWLDFDQDGRLDLYLVNNVARPAPGDSQRLPEARNHLYRQEADGRFHDVSAGSGLDVIGPGHGLAVGDVNNDGLPEVLLTEFEGVRLFLNRGNGKFEDVTGSAGLTNAEWSVTAAFFDYDRDGWLDLVVANYLDFDPSQRCLDARGRPEFCGPQGFRPTVTRLFRNTGSDRSGRGPRFVDVSVSSGIARVPGKAMQVVCADFDGDRWPDIFITDDALPNRLFMNRQNGTFEEEAVGRGVAYTGMGAPAANMGIALGDVDQDGRFDLFVPHLEVENHTLWRQVARGVFQDHTAQAGLMAAPWHGTGFGAVFGDFDNDSDLDLAVVNGCIRRPLPGARVWSLQSGIDEFWRPYAEPPQLFAGDAGGRFVEVSAANPAMCAEAVVGRGLAMADYDNDGGLDLLTIGIAGPARLVRGRGGSGHWLGVRAIDPAAGGRDAYGAEVIVEAGGRQQWRLVQSAGSYSSAQDPRAHFGLGAQSSFSSILVRWPDGSEEQFPGGSTDRYLTVRKGAGQSIASPSLTRAAPSSTNPGSAPLATSWSEPARADSSKGQPVAGGRPRLEVATQGIDPAVARLIAESQAAVQQKPRSADAWGKLGSVLLHYEYAPEARSALAEAERLAPADPRWPYLHAWLVMNTDVPVALAKLKRAVELAPAHRDAPRLRLANLLAERGELTAAEDSFNALLKRTPGHPVAQLGLARVLHQRGRPGDAARLLAACLENPHTRKAAHELLAAVQRAQGREPEARSAARRGAAFPADQSWPDPYWEEASAYRVGLKHRLADATARMDAGEPDRAIELLRKLAGDYPEDSEAWYLLGWAQNQRADPVSAERSLREHVKRSPASAKGMAQLAVALLAQRRPAEARSVLEEAVRLKPLWRELHSNLGFAVLQLGQLDEAERHYRNALRCDPNHVASHIAVAELLLRRGDAASRTEAGRLVEAARALSPDDPRARELFERLKTVRE